MTIGTDDMPVDLGMLEQQVNNVQRDVVDIKGALSQIATAITKLAILEERHQATQLRVEKLEDRVTETSEKVTKLNETNIEHVAMVKGMSGTLKVVYTLLAGLVGSGAVAAIVKFAH
jgi:regulator of replication initiation timing